MYGYIVKTKVSTSNIAKNLGLSSKTKVSALKPRF